VVHKANLVLTVLRVILVQQGELDKLDQLVQLECRDLRVRLGSLALVELQVPLGRQATLDNLAREESSVQLEQQGLLAWLVPSVLQDSQVITSIGFSFCLAMRYINLSK
jgi:hypothetical protein